MGPAQSTAAISDSNNAAPRAESFVPPLSRRCCGWCFGMVGRQGPPLRTGDWVELHGLNSSELNGARGEAITPDSVLPISTHVDLYSSTSSGVAGVTYTFYHDMRASNIEYLL